MWLKQAYFKRIFIEYGELIRWLKTGKIIYVQDVDEVLDEKMAHKEREDRAQGKNRKKKYL